MHPVSPYASFGWLRLLLCGSAIVATLGARAQTANFEMSATSGCTPLVVQFTDRSTGTPVAWEWDFGRTTNSSSVLQNPSTTYLMAGTYTVRLTVRYGSGATSTTTRTVAARGAPTISFSSDIQAGCLPSLPVQFTNTSTAGEGQITRWEWFFGDGGSSTLQNPSHSYTTAGPKTITLRAVNSVGCTSIRSQSNFIAVSGATLDFSASSACDATRNISFTNTSTGLSGQERFVWNFGDGNTSTDSNPTHNYTQNGSRNVSLSIDGAVNCSVNRPVEVGGSPIPALSIVGGAARCAGTAITFQSSSSGISSFDWDFGDGRQQTNGATGAVTTAYPTAGSYTVKLTATYTAGNCTGSSTQQVTIAAPLDPDFRIAGCEEERTFSLIDMPGRAITSWNWDFGDGLSATVAQPVHRYAMKDFYTVNLQLRDNFGCSGSVAKDIAVFDPPTADFTPRQATQCTATEPAPATLSGCAPHTIAFKNTSITGIPNDIGSAMWDFGDGLSSTENEPTHTFVNPGSYTVTMTAINRSGCQSQISRTVTVVATPTSSSFTFDKTRVCVAEEVHFTAAASAADSWCWTMGDEGPATGRTTTFKFRNVGKKDITLTAQASGCGIPVTIQEAIEVIGITPDFHTTFDCSDPFNPSFDNLSRTIDQQRDTWEWRFGDGQTSTTEYSASHRYAAAGTYMVRLTVTDQESGCTAFLENTIQVGQVRADFNATPRVGCKGTRVQFTNASTFASTYIWTLPGINPAEFQRTLSGVYPNAGNYAVSLTATDINGCQDTRRVDNFITILDISGDFTIDILRSRCNELDVAFTDASSGTPPITSWSWDFGDHSTASTQRNPSHTYHALGNYTVALTLSNALGQCTTTRQGAVVFTNPVANFSLEKKAYCVDESFVLTNLSQLASTYRWQIEGWGESTLATPSVTYSSVGNYDVSLTATDSYGCSVTATQQDTIHVVDVSVKFSADNVSADCPPLISTFTAQPSDEITEWSWDFGDGGTSTLEQPTYVYNRPGVYSVGVNVVSQYGCRASSSVTDLITLRGPYGSAEAQSEACLGESISFTSQTTGATKYLWDFGDGGSAPTANVAHVYKNAETYSPVLRLEDNNGCVVFVQPPNRVAVNPLPRVDFSLLEPYPFPKERVNLRATGDGIAWGWLVEGSNMHSEGATLKHAFSTWGILPVQLEVTDAKGCRNGIIRDVYVQEEIQFIPNVFTPNGDGKNTTFTILNVQNGIWDLTIYNRYGTLVYEQKNYDSTWRGGNLSEGVYYYYLKNRYRDRSYKGYIQIMR